MKIYCSIIIKHLFIHIYFPQGRQKLARFNGREFATLIIDILSDARRRQIGVTSPISYTLTNHHDKGRNAAIHGYNSVSL